MFQIEIHSKKDKVFAIQVEKIEDFLEMMKNSSIIWIADKGFWIPASEIALILFQKLSDAKIEPGPGIQQDDIDNASDEALERMATIDEEKHAKQWYGSSYNDSDNPRCNVKPKMSPCGDC